MRQQQSHRTNTTRVNKLSSSQINNRAEKQPICYLPASADSQRWLYHQLLTSVLFGEHDDRDNDNITTTKPYTSTNKFLFLFFNMVNIPVLITTI